MGYQEENYHPTHPYDTELQNACRVSTAVMRFHAEISGMLSVCNQWLCIRCYRFMTGLVATLKGSGISFSTFSMHSSLLKQIQWCQISGGCM